jgi:septal ring factor EnvC (AmiA/AmiB activator)
MKTNLENTTMDDTTVKIVADRLQSLHQDVNELKDSMRESMKEMSSAVTKLVLLEERNTQTVRLIERAMKELDDQKSEHNKLVDKVNNLAEQAPLNRQTNRMLDALIYAVVGGVLMFIGKKLGMVSLLTFLALIQYYHHLYQ